MPKNNRKLTKTVQFDKKVNVVFVEPNYNDDASTSQSPELGSVRDRVQQYQRKHLLSRSSSPNQRPPALPPRNAVQAIVRATDTVKSPPPPRDRKYTLSVCRQRLQRFKRNDQSDAAAKLAKRGDATAVVAIDDPPPKPHQRLVNQQATPTKNTDTEKSGWKRVFRRGSKPKQCKPDEGEEADDKSDSSDDKRRKKPGLIMSCLPFTVNCMSYNIC